ncbi:MAG TPA: CopD family protein [Verrucomicrobiae bacterium]|nr:CopD family protein [Verrucomicrobiae bacterium]
MTQLLGIFSFLVVLLRAAILCFQTVAVGGILFLLLVARNEPCRSPELLRPIWKLIRISAFVLVISQVFFVATNALVLSSSANIPLGEVVGANFVIAGAFAAIGGLAITFWPSQLRRNVHPLVLLPAGFILAASVMTSHSAARMDHRGVLVALTTLHYLAIANWVGGLPYLLLAMKRVTHAEARLRVTQGFSRLAQFSVALLFFTGFAMSWEYLGSWDAVYGTAYGVMVSTKVILFGCALILGAANYFIVRGLAAHTGDATASLVRYAEAEVGIGFAIILAAASLTSQPPGVDLTQERVSLQEIATRYAPRMPRWNSPPVKDLGEPSKLAYRKAQAAGKKLPDPFIPGQYGSGPSKPVDIAWSEYNHNWSGLIVFLMGILALLSRSRYFSWAKVWPLMFLGMAVFLFFRSDPENWPLGPIGFWESFLEADVLQHRLAVLLIIVFALFQWVVETNRVKSHAATLVFPAVCALGGVVLLTHSHALSNVKEELLVELSHTPLAILGIVAGWSRWLELRLPQENPSRKYLAWVWPVCFIFVGLILMDYHES